MDDLIPGNVKKIMADIRMGTVDIYMVPPSAIKIRPGFNEARLADPEYPNNVRMIADSIKSNGFYRDRPLVICATTDGLILSDGHTRFDAVMLAISEGFKVEAIPVVNEERGTTEEDRDVALVTRNNGTRLTPMGEALVLKRLLGRGVPETDAGGRLGFGTAKIRMLLDLVGAPKPIRDQVKSGTVSATLAVATLRSEGKDAVATLAKAEREVRKAGKTKVMRKHIPAEQTIRGAAALAAGEPLPVLPTKGRKGGKVPFTWPDASEVHAALDEAHRPHISTTAVGIVLQAAMGIVNAAP